MLILAIQIAATIYAFLHSHMVSRERTENRKKQGWQLVSCYFSSLFFFFQFENDFRDILHSSLKMYNGTDNMKASSSNGQDGLLVKTAWDKIMIEVLVLESLSISFIF